jgi:DNA-binding transcriptional ArsR family regulator
MKSDQNKKAYMKNHELLASVFKALSNPKRINILLALREERCRVGNMTECVGETFPILSQQLAILKRHGIVSRTKNKKNEVYYSITDEFTDRILNIIEEFDLISAAKKS